MPATSPLAFLQPTARTILTAAPLGGGLPPGATIGTWKLRSAGHRVGTRTRHAAVHVDTGQQGVMELFDAPSLLGGSYTSCLRTAIVDVMRVTHRGLPTFFDCGTLVDGRPYVVREAIDGCTLDELGVVAPRAVIKIIRGICDVVVAAHAVGVQHGQLDLDQILVRDRDGAIMLLDWRFTDDIANEALRRAQVTSTPTSRVPRAHSEAADVFDIGVVMLQLLGDDVPKPLETLVLEMCADEPQLRPTLARVVERLAAADDSLARGAEIRCAEIRCADTPAPRTAAEPEAEVVRLSQPLPPAFRIPSFLMSRRWRLSSLALTCAVPIAFGMLRDHRPVVASAEPVTTAIERVQPRIDPAPMPPPQSPPAGTRERAAVTPVAVKPAGTKPGVAVSVVAKPAAAVVAKPAAVVVAKPVVAKPASAVAAKPPREDAPAPVSNDGVLLRQYQRVGHDLIELERKLGPTSVAELRTSFREIHINDVMQSASSRQEATLALKDLERRIERMQPIEITDDCKNNPLANGCH